MDLLKLAMEVIKEHNKGLNTIIIHGFKDNYELNLNSNGNNEVQAVFNNYDNLYDNKTYALWSLLSDIDIIDHISFIEKVYDFE